MTLFRFALAAAAVAAVASAASAAEHWVFLGTYTGKTDKDSKGIYRCKFDDATGTLSDPELAAEMLSPSFLAIHPNKQFLYAVGEGGSKEGGPVVAFALDAKTGKLTKLNEDKSGGPGPCHIAISPDGKWAAAANYGGGSTAIFELGPDGKIVKRVAFFQHKEEGKNPHGHCCAFNLKSDHLFTVDLGLDKVKAFDLENGKWDEHSPDDVALPAKSGPRHIAIAPDGKFWYVCGELASTVNVITGGKTVQTLSTLPNPVKGNSTAECIMSPDGKFVYVSNRGHNSIAVFKVKGDRMLEAAGHITGDIKTPRNFNIDPSGKWMLIASQAGGKVGVWELDRNSGNGKETGKTVAVDRCVCVKFVPVAK